jgi:plastocyanin
MKPARAAWPISCLCLAAPAFAAPPVQHQVVIEGMRFTPQVVQVKPGDTITWENRDMVAHNVTAHTGRPHSGDLQPGQSWRYKVQPGGSFDYICTLHPMMTARVELADLGKQPHAPRDPPAKMK